MVNHENVNSYVVVPYRYLERLAEIARINDITPYDALCYVMGRGLEIVTKESEKIVPKGEKGDEEKDASGKCS